MPNTREKLIELQLQADIEDEISENTTQHREFTADLMIANGVTVQSEIDAKTFQFMREYARLREENRNLGNAVNALEQINSDLVKQINGVTVQEWISVKDRLPELRTKVLCCGKKGGRFIAELSTWGNGNLYWDKHNGKGCSEVVYWMPLPNAPEPPAPEFRYEKGFQPHGAEQFAKACGLCVNQSSDLCRECKMEKKSGFEPPF